MHAENAPVNREARRNVAAGRDVEDKQVVEAAVNVLQNQCVQRSR